MKPEIITISGPPGSGTSTVSQRIADKLGYSRFSSGNFMRSLARERGVSLQKLQSEAESNPAIDERIDEKVKDLADSDEIVVDSRLGFHFIPEGFAVYLEVGMDAAARRIFAERKERQEQAEIAAESIQATKERIRERLASERQRYQELYNIDHTNLDHYDLVVDTETKDVAGVVNTVIDEYCSWAGNKVQACKT